jgi:predicted porin
VDEAKWNAQRSSTLTAPAAALQRRDNYYSPSGHMFYNWRYLMKKTLIAAAVLSGFGGAAMAQNATIYGIVDASVVRLDDGVNDLYRLDSGRNAASRFGVRGNEDLGGGLKAVYLLESQMDVSNGGTTTGKFWSRLAYVGLEGGFGGFRMGRQDSPMRTALNVIDPFMNAGMAGAIDYFGYNGDYGGSSTLERVDNQVTYILPSGIGGLNGSAAYAFGESSNGTKPNASYAFNVGYGAGPVAVQFAYSRQSLGTNATATAAYDGRTIDMILGATYDFGVVKLHAGYHDVDGEDATGATTNDTQGYLVGVTVPLGDAIKFRGTYIWNKVKNVSNYDSSALNLSLTYALSKRTTLYLTGGLTDNDSLSDLGIIESAADGHKATGIAFGVQHNF